MKKKVIQHEPLLTIGTVSGVLGVAVQTIRLYEREGLVIPHRTQTGRRMYSTKDLERLKCIRKMIVDHGLNISGIRRLMSMIPCWEFRGGLDTECKKCPAYYDAEGPCWTLEKVGSKCRLADCRSCPVYAVEFSCHKLKEVVFGHRRDETEANFHQ